MKNLKIFMIGSILAFLWWLTYGDQREIAIDLKTCEPEGLVAKYREFVWGRDFKVNQIAALKSSIISGQRLDAMLVDFDQKLKSNSITRDVGRMMNEARVKNASPEYRDFVIAQIQAEEAKELAEKMKRDADQQVFEELKKVILRDKHACIEKLTSEIE